MNDHLPTRACDAELRLSLLAFVIFCILYATNNHFPYFW